MLKKNGKKHREQYNGGRDALIILKMKGGKKRMNGDITFFKPKEGWENAKLIRTLKPKEYHTHLITRIPYSSYNAP